MVLCAIGNEESADTDSGEKVRMTTSILLTDIVHSFFCWQVWEIGYKDIDSATNINFASS